MSSNSLNFVHYFSDSSDSDSDCERDQAPEPCLEPQDKQYQASFPLDVHHMFEQNDESDEEDGDSSGQSAPNDLFKKPHSHYLNMLKLSNQYFYAKQSGLHQISLHSNPEH